MTEQSFDWGEAELEMVRHNPYLAADNLDREGLLQRRPVDVVDRAALGVPQQQHRVAPFHPYLEDWADEYGYEQLNLGGMAHYEATRRAFLEQQEQDRAAERAHELRERTREWLDDFEPDVEPGEDWA